MNESHLSGSHFNLNNIYEPAISGYQQMRHEGAHLMNNSLEALSRNLARLNRELSQTKQCIKRKRPDDREESDDQLNRRRKIPKSY